MCGFIDLFLHKNEQALKAVVHEKGDKLISHRGPDDQGSFKAKGVYMSFHRLSIMDPTEAGHQPMTSKCGRYVMTYNGEIYNFRSLIEKYDLKDLRSQSDSEVLLELYAKIKNDVCEVIRGMYAFIIYDKKDRTYFGARDTFGIKPLYYTQTEEGVFFSSEIKPLLQFIKEIKVNERAVFRYLISGNMDDLSETFYQGVYQIPAGHLVNGDAQTIKITKGEKLSINTLASADQEQYTAEYHQLLLDKVSQYLYSDVPVGVSLSGGFDSSLLAYLIHANERGQSLHMFCRGYEDYEGNELEAARAIGEKFNFQYHEAILSPSEVPALLTSSSFIQEHPVTSISILAFHKLYQVARSVGLKVLLEGHGGDESWAGYAYYAKAFESQVNGLNQWSHDGSPLQMNREVLKFKSDAALLNLDETIVESPAGLSALTKMQLMDMFGGKMQRSLRYVDRASMYQGIEVRLPFLDFDITRQALCMPDGWKIKDGHYRHFMRRLAQGPLGKEVAFRQKVPIQDPQRLWLQTHLSDYVRDTLSSTDLFIERYVDIGLLRNHYESFLQHPGKYPNLTFIVFPLCLEAWYQGMKEYINDEILQYQSGS